jgi:predicted Zn-dependent peptidase
VEAAIHEEIARLIREPPSEDEMARVRRRLEAGEVRGLVSNQGLAFRLADSAALWGTWRGSFDMIGRMAEVEADDIVRLVQDTLVPEGRTVATLGRGGAP